MTVAQARAEFAALMRQLNVASDTTRKFLAQLKKPRKLKKVHKKT
jgi:DeoR/GlpR family transcriptional regulator of sugar metabolism